MKGYAVITGASSGIGLAFAKQLAKRGYSLILIARNEKRLREAAKRLPVKCKVIAADLAKEEECYSLFEKLEKEDIDIFINNAGFGDCGRFVETDIEKELAMIKVNIKAMHILMKFMLQKMNRAGEGYILNVASASGLLPGGPYMATYYASKSYLTSLTRSVAWELKEAGSRVYVGCLCPGPVDTAFNETANVEFMIKAITAKECAAYALKQMQKRKVVIIPTVKMKLAVGVRRFVPECLCIKAIARQQKRSFGSADLAKKRESMYNQ